jgi:tetratricopeptide (TPR) repeat protein
MLRPRALQPATSAHPERRAVMKLFTLAVLHAVLALACAEPAAASEAPGTFSKNSQANDLFLKARNYLDRSDPRVGGQLANAREAIKLYQQAVDKDPGFALAYVDMARAYLRLGYSNPDGASNDDIMPPARSALAKAVAVDPGLADAHLMLAALAFNIDYEWDKADREYSRGIELQPENADAHANYAAYLSSMGRFREALAQMQRANALAPSAATDFAFARVYYAMRRYQSAADYCHKSLAQQDNMVVRFYLGLIDVAQRRYDKAIPELEATTAENNGGALAGLAYAYAMDGQRERARELLDKLYAGRESGLIVPYRVAAVYVALGDKDQAIKWLRKSYDDHDNWLAQLQVDPVMDPLRADARFQELMRKMRFSASARSAG